VAAFASLDVATLMEEPAPDRRRHDAA
jgi:hypothetical protein